jgi:small subunit ribosomal protein S9
MFFSIACVCELNIIMVEKKTTTTKTKTGAKYHYGSGKRKDATARAKYFVSGEPLTILVNGKDYAVYFPELMRKYIDNVVTNIGLKTGQIHFFINGGGASGQAQAARLALAKALVAQDEGYRPVLRSFGYLTTDIRIVEPKKAGLRKARKREQWSKR